MNVVAVFVVLAVIGVVAAVVSGVVRGDLAEPTSSLPPAGVPDGELVPEDLQAVRFSLGFRGYRMDEVDEVLDRVAVELVRRDAEIERLRGLLSRAAATAGASGGPAEDGVAGAEHDDVPEHHGRHLRPERARDVHAADEHRADEHRADDHRTDLERPGEYGSNGAAPASVAPAGRPPGWPGSDGT